MCLLCHYVLLRVVWRHHRQRGIVNLKCIYCKNHMMSHCARFSLLLVQLVLILCRHLVVKTNHKHHSDVPYEQLNHFSFTDPLIFYFSFPFPLSIHCRKRSREDEWHLYLPSAVSWTWRDINAVAGSH